MCKITHYSSKKCVKLHIFADMANELTFFLTSSIEKNKETVAWLRVNNTNVNYPVVQTKNNEYFITFDEKVAKLKVCLKNRY